MNSDEIYKLEEGFGNELIDLISNKKPKYEQLTRLRNFWLNRMHVNNRQKAKVKMANVELSIMEKFGRNRKKQADFLQMGPLADVIMPFIEEGLKQGKLNIEDLRNYDLDSDGIVVKKSKLSSLKKRQTKEPSILNENFHPGFAQFKVMLMNNLNLIAENLYQKFEQNIEKHNDFIIFLKFYGLFNDKEIVPIDMYLKTLFNNNAVMSRLYSFIMKKIPDKK